LLETNAFPRQPVNVRGLGIVVSKARKVAPSHVVNKDQNNVRAICRDGWNRYCERKDARE
jgi:hypothetical protein